MVLRFLRVLELSSDLKSEIFEVLKIIIETFEYSEVEMDKVVVVRKRKLFGFI
jgi:hypothetical protein